MDAETQSVKVNKDIKAGAIYALGLLIALVGILAKMAFTDLQHTVEKSSAAIADAVTTINSHTTKIEILELRVHNLEVASDKAAAERRK